jgi:hypothetical protein
MGTGERNIRQRTRTAATAAARIVVFAVLGYAGLMKLNQPQPTAEFLDSLIQVHSVGLVRTIGVGELALALLVISGAASLWAGPSGRRSVHGVRGHARGGRIASRTAAPVRLPGERGTGGLHSCMGMDSRKRRNRTDGRTDRGVSLPSVGA